MRLLSVETLKLEEYFGETVPKYALLSHCWGPKEIDFRDVNLLQSSRIWALRKIGGAIARCRTDRISYIWIDTCCIDKSSSAELSEAINSMFNWYENSTVCYVYLEDVDITRGNLTTDSHKVDGLLEDGRFKSLSLRQQ